MVYISATRLRRENTRHLQGVFWWNLAAVLVVLSGRWLKLLNYEYQKASWCAQLACMSPTPTGKLTILVFVIRTLSQLRSASACRISECPSVYLQLSLNQPQKRLELVLLEMHWFWHPKCPSQPAALDDIQPSAPLTSALYFTNYDSIRYVKNNGTKTDVHLGRIKLSTYSCAAIYCVDLLWKSLFPLRWQFEWDQEYIPCFCLRCARRPNTPHLSVCAVVRVRPPWQVLGGTLHCEFCCSVVDPQILVPSIQLHPWTFSIHFRIYIPVFHRPYDVYTNACSLLSYYTLDAVTFYIICDATFCHTFRYWKSTQATISFFFNTPCSALSLYCSLLYEMLWWALYLSTVTITTMDLILLRLKSQSWQRLSAPKVLCARMSQRVIKYPIRQRWFPLTYTADVFWYYWRWDVKVSMTWIVEKWQ